MISVRKEGMRPKKKQETVGSLRKKCADMATCVDTNTISYAQTGRKRETATSLIAGSATQRNANISLKEYVIKETVTIYTLLYY